MADGAPVVLLTAATVAGGVAYRSGPGQHPSPPPRNVVVIGGGFSGLAVTIHLLRDATAPLAVTVLEPRERLGRGVAYSTPERLHTTNVPASRMSADPDDPDAFARWLGRHGDAPTGDERDSYPRRVLYGGYLDDVLARALAASQGRLTHLRCTARDIVPRETGGFTVLTDDAPIGADAVVLATGNPAPTWPAALGPLAAAPVCVGDPWRPGALSGIAPDARVLIVGTGLTMGDTVAALRDHGHRGPLVALSRRGQLPQRGLAQPAAPFGAFGPAPTTASGLVRLARRELGRAREAGLTWHGVLAAGRNAAWPLWAALPPMERRRLARHFRHLYELHRHVMPGPIHDLVMAEQASGTLRVLAGALTGARCEDGRIVVSWLPRGQADDTAERFDAVVNCTGPAYGRLTRTDPIWAALARRGLVSNDPTGLGPAVDREGRALDAGGTPQPALLVAGTLARSAYGELTGVREIFAQARLVAAACLGTTVTA